MLYLREKKFLLVWFFDFYSTVNGVSFGARFYLILKVYITAHYDLKYEKSVFSFVFGPVFLEHGQQTKSGLGQLKMPSPI